MELQNKPTPDFLKQNEGKTRSNSIEVPSITIPKGGGAIKGIDETFSVNAVNGTSSFSIPLPFSPARGASPTLSLSYNSGSGNGVFGLGWNINLGSIRRKTDKGIPQYRDIIDSDTFLFSEAEDLVPAFKKNNDGSFEMTGENEYVIQERISTDGQFRIRNYLPRIESLFAKIERWTEVNSARTKWRVISRDNTTTLFGWTEQAVIADPANPERIFEWLPEFTFDDKGNCAYFLYKKDDLSGFDTQLLHNKNRVHSGALTYTNTYLEKVLYGNRTPYQKFGMAFPPEQDYLFQTVFDYGQPVHEEQSPDSLKVWDFRPDAFSDYKAGFEIRTTRLCKRVLLFHILEELAVKPDKSDRMTLVRSVNFEYDTSTEQDFTFLKSATFWGYIKKQDGTYSQKHLPPMEFAYQKHEWNREIKTIEMEALQHAPVGIETAPYQWVDLYNEGLSGILSEQANGWYYKHNLGDGQFAPAKLVTPKPSFSGLGGQLHLADLDADGGRQLVNLGTEPKGFFELQDDNNWSRMKPFSKFPTIDFTDTNTRLFDLDGDGRAEVVITEENVFTWYTSDGRKGYLAAQKTAKPTDEEEGPHVVFADGEQSIFLADMSGDGMIDIVRIRNGEICYWPNLGYGKFGAKVSCDNAPIFDHPDTFNPAYLRLADIDGSGTTDIIYLGRNKCACWKNLSGNRFSKDPFEIDPFPEIHSQSRITVTDLLGNGVACIVWSSPLPNDHRAPLKYIDLMNGRKPHILVGYKNNLGKEVKMEYKPSTFFYLEDKKANKPWVTKLHFPVHCVAKTISEDKVSGVKFISEYKYHHGYYDHAEREFRGFGLVEQIDAETYEHWIKQDASNITEEAIHQEPVVSRSWHHTGAFQHGHQVLNHYSNDYWYREMERHGFPVDSPEINLPDARMVVAPGIDPEILSFFDKQDYREASRACKGMALRIEIFAKDAIKFGSTEQARIKELTPYSVATHNCIIELIQPKGQNKHAVFIANESESITYNYERDIRDPRIAHHLNIQLDEYGNILESASIVYPRKQPDPGLSPAMQEDQNKTVIIFNESKFTNDVSGEDIHRLRVPSETKTYELKGVPKSTSFYNPANFIGLLINDNTEEAAYHEINKPISPGKVQKRLLEHVRSIWYRDDLSGPLPLHRLESLAIHYESYQLAYTPDLVTDIFGDKVTSENLQEGRFNHSEGDVNWWVRSGTIQYITENESQSAALNRFYNPLSYTDPYGVVTKVKYYGSYFLLIEETEDVWGNKSTVAAFNFRSLSPRKMKDINGNYAEVLCDELGMVKAMAIMGKGNEADELTGLTEETETGEIELITHFFQAPDSAQLSLVGKTLLNRSTTRFVCQLDAYVKSGKPVVMATISREQHYQQLADSPIQISFEYSNGIGEVVMQKKQAEPGLAKKITIDNNNKLIVKEIDTASFSPSQLRWIGNGKTIRNNKGNAVKQYEPFFSVNWQFEDQKELVETGVTPIMYYDSIGRLVKTELPNGTFSKVEFDAWKQVVFDTNDTVLESKWYTSRIDQVLDPKETRAAQKAAKHAHTPHTLHFDTLGQPTLSIAHNKDPESQSDILYTTYVTRDSEGNLLAVTDARGNTVMLYKYDMLGTLVYQNSMDAGQRWLLNNILGDPLRTWDERNHEFQYFYDQAHRPTYSKVIGGDGNNPLNHIFDRIIYGELQLQPGRANEIELKAKNVLGKPIQHYDTGGLIDTPGYDFKGHPLSTRRRLFRKYKEVADWRDENLITDLEEETYSFITDTDALGRITKQITPDGSIIIPTYNEAGMLNGEKVTHADPAVTTDYIKDIDYNEKGQRTRIIYGNGVSTLFQYDKESFRLKHIETKGPNNDLLQDCHYTYDPVGNMTEMEDKNIPTVFYNNQMVSGVSDYTYDALYRLQKATGRENNAGLAYTTQDNWNDNSFMHQISPGDPVALRNYTETYQYDQVGNILSMRHQSDGNNWTRNYTYQSDNNRLISTQVGDQTYLYPHQAKHGFITAMPHLEAMSWNFQEQLVSSIRQRRSDGGTPEITYYQYDGSGQRIRKITENQATPGNTPTKKEERIYLAGYEIYKKHSGPDAGLERTSLSLMDDDLRYLTIETRNNIDDGSEKNLVRYQFHNHLGSSTLELDELARVISYEEYHPYGSTAYQAKNATIKATAKRYRYTGMERDEETGLEYHSARYYLPWLGRWLSGDPLGLVDGANIYVYSSNAPINVSDKSGRTGEEWQHIETEDPTANYQQNTTTGTVVVQGPGRKEVWAETSGASGQYLAVYQEYHFPDDKLIANQTTLPPELDLPVPAPEPVEEPPDIEGDNSTLETAADIATDFIPIVGSGKDLYRGIRDGDGWGIALGIGGLALDIATLGSGSVVKGAVKTGIKQGAKQVAKQEVKQIVKQEAKQIAMGGVEQSAKKTSLITSIPGDTGPYSAQRMRKHLVDQYGNANVSSTTVPSPSTPNLRKKAVDIGDGRSVGFDERGLPDFSPFSITTARVARGSYKGEMRAATRQLRDALARGENVGVIFNADQLRAIKAGKSTIPGYRWHHVSGGELQLIPAKIHNAINHIGSGAMRSGR